MEVKSVSLGRKYGRLLILGQWITHHKSRVLAQCDCGTLKEYRLECLKRGTTKSCGCFRKEVHTKHQMAGSNIYFVWSALVQRCTNSRNVQYKNYGGRGITVCDSWLKFENFYSDMGDSPKGLTLDRIDNNKGYFKENCHWVTQEQNMINTRRSKFWIIKGVVYGSLKIASSALGVGHTTIQRWCDGGFNNGKLRSPKSGCKSEVRYSVDERLGC